MTVFRGSRWLFVATERGDRVLALNIDDPASPQVTDIARVGDRPEGMTLLHQKDRLILITGDEGNEGPGEISFVAFR